MAESRPQTMTASEPILAWPGWKNLGDTLSLCVLYGAIFYIVYGGANAITGLYAHRWTIGFEFERSIPFIPAMAAVYVSLNLMLGLAPFILRTRRAMMPLFATITAETVLAGVIFIALPLKCSFPEVRVEGWWVHVYRVADTVNLEHNEFPSLHVALSVTTVAAYARGRSAWVKYALAAWAVAIIASTLLIHAHHLVDLVGGGVLAWAGMRFVYPRFEYGVDEEGRVNRIIENSDSVSKVGMRRMTERSGG